MAQNIIQSAPLLSRVREKGGTLYTFSTTVNDFSHIFSQSSVRMIPSKFLALKLPTWSNTTTHKMYADPSTIGAPFVTDPNYVFPKVIQNYAENMLQYSDAYRTDGSLQTYAEPAILKTLAKLGALQLVDSGTTIVENGITKKIYNEAPKSASYDPIIKFVGEINLMNHVKEGGVEYHEVFCSIPTEAGAMTGVKFKAIDINHSASAIPTTVASETTVGLDQYVGTDSVSAIFDDQANKKYSVGSDADELGVWFDDIRGDVTRQNQGDFEFNAILIYYDIFDTNDATTKRTNAYGLLLMDKFTVITAGSGEIQKFKKYQPDATQPGNAFAERFILKFSSYSQQVTSQISINSYSTVSMELYMDALRRLSTVTSLYESAIKRIDETVETVNKINDFVYDYKNIKNALSTIKTMADDVEKLKTARTNDSNVRITNEELYELFRNAITAANSVPTGGNINITSILSPRLYLPKVIDAANMVVEMDTLRYKWNATTNNWESI